MLLPNRTLLIALAGWFGLAVAATVWPSWLGIWQFSGAALLSAALADAWLALSRRNPVRVERKIKTAWPVGVTQTVQLRLTSPERSAAGWLFDRHPEAFSSEGLPLFFELPRGHWAKLGYGAQPLERGPHAFGPTELRLLSPLRLWLTQHRIGDGDTVHVYPDFAKITRYALFATDNRLSQIGVLRRQRRGEGLDFRQLREYCRDDDLRQIDWKATARVRKPIAREYQDERDQNIVFLLDCGQRMRTKDDALSHFDHTLNALLLLSYVALRQGDGVGFSTFAQAEPRYVAPRKSLVTVERLLNAVYDLQPSLQTPDYLTASQILCERLSKRSLIVLLTNLRDEDESTLPPALAALRRRHLVLLANLRETSLDAVLREPVIDLDGALTYAAAVDYRRERRRQLAALRAQGVVVLDVAPAELPVALVNRYWDMKRSGVF